MRERLSRVFWPALVAGAFCLPLFIGLGNRDLRGDEAGHAFSVDRILETGEWLIPKMSPHPDAPFLEKPPLKFWIVAAGMRAGLPNNEFGQRFWDPVFGGIAFLYVFAIGRRLAGSVCGAVAVLILFVIRNLLFEHGLRDNAMEAPLVLSYCGGIFHYLAWSTASGERARRAHAIAVAAYFALGFMVKFVAALFLPMLLGLVSVSVKAYRGRLIQDWRSWSVASLVALALIAPWFIYANSMFGVRLWHTIFGIHVYTRLTSFLDPEHVHPWNYYLDETYRRLDDSGAFWLVVIGATLLAIDTVRRRMPEGLLVLIWFVVPVTIMSMGTSKLYHYAYPFLPPVGLAGGYVIARLWEWLRPRIDAIMRALDPSAAIAQRHPRLDAILRAPAARTIFLSLAALAVGIAVWTAVVGAFSIHLGEIRIRNSRVLRPVLMATLLLILAGQTRLVGRIATAVLLLVLLPIPAYRATLEELGEGQVVFRPVRDCVLRVESQPALATSGRRGLYVDGEGVDYQVPFSHEYSYYFRTVEPWIRPRETPAARLQQFLVDPREQRPLLMTSSRYHAVWSGIPASERMPISPPAVRLHGDAVLVLPGPFAVCDPDSAKLRSRP